MDEDKVPMKSWKHRLRDLYISARKPILFTLAGATFATVGLYAGVHYSLPEGKIISFEDEPHQVIVPRPDQEHKSYTQRDKDGNTVYRYTEETAILKAPDGRYIFRKRETHDVFMKPGEMQELPDLLDRFRQFQDPGNQDPKYFPDPDRDEKKSIDHDRDVDGTIDDKVVPI